MKLAIKRFFGAIFCIIAVILSFFSVTIGIGIGLEQEDIPIYIFLLAVTAIFWAAAIATLRSAGKSSKNASATESVEPLATANTDTVSGTDKECDLRHERLFNHYLSDKNIVSQAVRTTDTVEPVDPRDYMTAKQKHGSYELLSGLNIPAGTTCKIVAAGDRMVISALKQEYTIQNRKIISVDIQTVKNFQQQYVSSVGGAVAGGVFLGPLGAILGGMAQKKTVENTTPLLILAYEKEQGDIRYIVFKLPPNGSYYAKQLVSIYKKPTKNLKTSINL